MIILFLVLILNMLAHSAHGAVLSVVQEAVAEREFNVIGDFSDIFVLVVAEFGFDRAKIHGGFHDFMVVEDLQLFRINRLMEDPSLVDFPQVVQQSSGGFVPGFKDRGGLRNIRKWQLFD